MNQIARTERYHWHTAISQCICRKLAGLEDHHLDVEASQCEVLRQHAKLPLRSSRSKMINDHLYVECSTCRPVSRIATAVSHHNLTIAASFHSFGI